jgi:hypothetical protein
VEEGFAASRLAIKKKEEIMKLPATITGVLKDRDVISAVRLLMVEERPTTMCCAGAMCVRRELSPFMALSSIDVHYTAKQVYVKQERVLGRQYRKDKMALNIDLAYDSAFKQALEKFEEPSTWYRVNKKVETFILRLMKPWIGQSFTLTLIPRQKSSRPTLPNQPPKTGGHVRIVGCQKTRLALINKILKDKMMKDQETKEIQAVMGA